MTSKLSMTCNSLTPPHPALPTIPLLFTPTIPIKTSYTEQRQKAAPVFAAKTGGFSLNSIFKRCETCGGKGAIECLGCKGTGKNKKNGNIFERWKCFDCQGFGLKSCPNCGQGVGLTPEQRGER